MTSDSTSDSNARLTMTLAKIDEANARDPNREIVDGAPVGKELLYSVRMTQTLNELFPDASEHLQIAARAQHIERWTSPRSDYPAGRSGYKKWRSQLMLFHAGRAAELMIESGYTQSDVDRVKYLIQKRGLNRDSETQRLEDVICIVFIKYYLKDFAKQHPEDKLIDIVQKTWGKMSPAGREHALKLDLEPGMQSLISRALSRG